MWVLRFVVCGQSGFWVLLLILEQLQLVVFISDFKHLLSDWNPDNFNPLAPNLPFLYPLKISEIITVFWCFQGVEKGCIGKELVNTQNFLDVTSQLAFTFFVLRMEIEQYLKIC